ncbi:MAG: HAMP domain-containing protein [Spirochaetaceae bacterium]|nr:MAG: HAMP domain-containing protein [Spirochaetaceae bacterium]
MKHRLSHKLSIVFASLFAVVLVASAFSVHWTVRRELAASMRSNLKIASDLIRRLVETRADEQWGALAGAVQMADLMVGTSAAIDPHERHRHTVYNDYTGEFMEVDQPGLMVGGRSVSFDSSLAMEISRRYHGIAAFYQRTDHGLVLVSTSHPAPERSRGLATLYPTGTPVYDLVMRYGSFQRRDHFHGAWHLTAWQVLSEGDTIVGAVFLAVKQVEMDRMRRDVLSILLAGDGFPYVIDASSSRVVFHPSIEGESLWQYPHIRDVQFRRDGFLDSVVHDIHTSEPREHVLSYSYIRPMNWIVIAEAPTEVFFGRLRILQLILLLIFGGAMVASVLLSLLVGSQITRPIQAITGKIKEISEGEADLTRRLDVISNDEVGELCEYFNAFVSKLHRLKLVEQREVEMQLRDAQMNALEAQINPHFLYNTLETIRYMIAGGHEQAVEVVQDLADLLRLSIGHGERYVTLRHELDHVMRYLAIQRVRYENRFDVALNVDRQLDGLYTAKFILQPLVENALIHGFRTTESGGVIRINGWIESHEVRLSVEDNGCGMASSTLRRLKGRIRQGRSDGSIGLLNVSERLRLYFGDTYGVQITSRENAGTCVTLRLPLLPIEPEQVEVVHAVRRAPVRMPIRRSLHHSANSRNK